MPGTKNFSNRSRVSNIPGGSDNVGQTFVTIFGHVIDVAPAASISGFLSGSVDDYVIPSGRDENFLMAAALAYGYDGAGSLIGDTISRFRNASAVNVAQESGQGVQMTSLPGMWTVVHTPASATQATASRAATANGGRNVCTSIDACFILPSGVTQVIIQLNLRDGASGAGTILWSRSFGFGAVATTSIAQQEVSLTGLSIPGSVDTAMTLEFSAAGAATTVQSVTLCGYTAQPF